MDGTIQSLNNEVSYGKVIRDCFGRFISSFTYRIGYYLDLETELWGMFHGLKSAYGFWLRKFILESNSVITISLISGKVQVSYPYNQFVRVVQKFLMEFYSMGLIIH